MKNAGLISIFVSIILVLNPGCATSPYPYSPAELTGAHAGKQTVKSSSGSNRKKMVSVNGYYTVRPGDTLYSVAFVHNMDYQTLALINGIKSPYTINVGQRLLTDTGKSTKKLYRVTRGDTVYNISKRYGLTPAALMTMNSMGSNCNIRIGQMLVVGKNTGGSARTSESGTVTRSGSVASTRNGSKTSVSQTSKKQQEQVIAGNGRKGQGADRKPQTTASKNTSVSQSQLAKRNGKVKWHWPTGGSVIEGYSSSNRGIDISGRKGDSVRSAAKGKIVYAGDALRGYGNLIIINHDDDYLSAYAHNDAILVTEGQMVESGQVIARMGDTDAKSVRLHFEIRHNGESVNPLNYLPKRK